MPKTKSKRAVRQERREKKKPKSDAHKKGGRPIHFDFFCRNQDLDVLVRKKLAEVEGKTDEDSQHRREQLEQILAILPSKIPPRDGHPPLEGERDHYYLRFFHLLTENIESGRYYKSFQYDIFHNTHRNMYCSWKNHFIQEPLAHLNYFDHGADHPGARKPPNRRRALKHIKHMQAKRAKTAAPGI
jgi:hypothetical protein